MNCSIISTPQKGEGCTKQLCRHNMFWDKLNLNKKARPTESSLEFSNCMCLLDREMTLEEIGEMWGMSRERIRQIERDAMIKILKFGQTKTDLLEDLEVDKNLIKKRYNALWSKKCNKHHVRNAINIMFGLIER